MKKFIIANALIGGAVIATPLMAFAQSFTALDSIVAGIGGIVTALVPIAFAAALLFFFWGLAKYIMASGNEEAQAAGKTMMLWGVVALFVMSSIWGLIAFLQTTVGVDPSKTTGTIPKAI